jgi:hypothetical protein
MTSVPIKRARVCKYCDHGSGIIWHEEDAMKMFDGSWKCLSCLNRDANKTTLRVLGVEHPKSKTIVAEAQKTVDQWNDYAQSMNDLNKRMGGNKDILELKRNPYLS